MAEIFRASKMTHSGHDLKAGIQLGSFGARKGDKR